jgi:hypothetical protein
MTKNWNRFQVCIGENIKREVSEAMEHLYEKIKHLWVLSERIALLLAPS